MPGDMRPNRFAIATNFLVSYKDKLNTNYFLLFNYEPEKWNQWYPYFYSTSSNYSFSANTYGELVDEYNKNISVYQSLSDRIKKGSDAFSELLHINNSIEVKENIVPVEYWLKYSKTQHIWTLYIIEFLQIIKSPGIDFEKNRKITLMPFDEKTKDEIKKSGKYKEVTLVDNFLRILFDDSILDMLYKNSLILLD
jgi:hypothetical protein